MFGFDDDFLAVEAELRRIEMPAMIDHMGGLDYRRGPSQPAVRLILDLLAKDNWWIGLSNGDLRSHTGHPWNDAVEFGRLFYQAAPDRCMWGTDWPHVHRFIRPDKDGPSDYGVEHQFARIALLERYVPDRKARDRVLVDNPARFFGFDLVDRRGLARDRERAAGHRHLAGAREPHDIDRSGIFRRAGIVGGDGAVADLAPPGSNGRARHSRRRSPRSRRRR